ncbi:restriction system modified-DNA reader domain-containing protein [Streptomyces jumonjinensis]|uniref:restriction system modified-DNA reader domain-containing protein n=1 Tax=Streptomyces jumonjinensis TaxID=1945 RepID=UPI00378A34A9
MKSLSEALTECARKIEGFQGRSRSLNEANTKASLIEVVLRGLGWDVSDPDEVDREYGHESRHNPTDYALVIADRPKQPYAVVEAKALGKELTNPEIVSQVLGYAADTGAECAVVTNGDEWHLFNAYGTAPGQDRLYRAVKVTEAGHETARVLSLLSKDSLRSDTLQRLWLADRADRQISTALRQVLTPTGQGHDGLLAALSPLLPKCSQRDIQDSLSRLRVSLDFSPPTFGTQAPIPQGPRPTATAQKPRRTHPPITGAERSTTLADLLNAGRLLPGDLLRSTYKGVEHTAELHADGSLVISALGMIFKSLSAAAVAVKHAVNGSNPQDEKITDRGWPFWSATDHVVGDQASLLKIRYRHAESLNQSATKS